MTVAKLAVFVVADGYVAVTPLHLDLTHDPSLAALGERFTSNN